MKKCAVIGSINMDMVVRTPRFPAAGETLIGPSFSTVPGGKGANQAIALARLGVETRMAGMVGDDSFGQVYLNHFAKNGVNCEAVGIARDTTTGVADILVSDEGENCIVAVQGANGLCGAEWYDGVKGKVQDCDILLMQLEIPMETVEKCAEEFHAMGKTVILDPAPAAELSAALLRNVDYITPNETELAAITPELDESAGMEARLKFLTEKCGATVIHKRGADGAYIATREEIVHVPGFKVRAVDTTAAGDTFNAGFAAGLAMGMSLPEAVKLANAAGALAVTKLGAQEGMPTYAEAQSKLLPRWD